LCKRANDRMASLMFVRSHRHPELDADCVAFASPTGHYVDVSNGVCRLLGYGRAQLVGRHIADITAPASANVKQMFAEYRKAGEQHGFYVLGPVEADTSSSATGRTPLTMAAWRPCGSRLRQNEKRRVPQNLLTTRRKVTQSRDNSPPVSNQPIPSSQRSLRLASTPSRSRRGQKLSPGRSPHAFL